MTTATKISSHKNESTYRSGPWLIQIERKSSRTYACGMTRTSSWSEWSAIDMETGKPSQRGTGGIKIAVAKLAKI